MGTQQTITSANRGKMLLVFDTIQIKNDKKITNDDRQFCYNVIGENSKIVAQFDSDNVNISETYNLKTSVAKEMKFFTNGRIDVCLKDKATTQKCFYRMKLNEIYPKKDQ